MRLKPVEMKLSLVGLLLVASACGEMGEEGSAPAGSLADSAPKRDLAER